MSKTQKRIRDRPARLLVPLLLSLVFLSGCQATNGGDRYFTWVDENGQVRHTLIPEEKSPVEERAKVVAGQREDTEEPQASGNEERRPSKPEVGETASADADEIPSDEVAAAGATEKPTNPEYNLSNYPDGNELAAKGFVREGDPLPYFTWRDAQGNVRVSTYRPEGMEDVKGNAEPQALQLTPAMVLDGRRPPTPKSMASDAMTVMGMEETASILQDWTASCCQRLPVRDAEQWYSSREFQVDLTEQSPEFAFSTGRSTYRLIQLPSGEVSDAFIMRLRSYINDGVFVPTLAFLDEQLHTRRLVTDLAFDFNPETWHSHGSLEARVPVFPKQGDRWLLVMSRQEDQQGQTVYETDGWPTAIPHSAHGTLGIAEVE